MDGMAQRARVVLLATAICIGSNATLVGFASAQVPGRCEVHVSQRTSENGCYVSATVSLGELPSGPLFWHLYTYPSRTEAEAVSGPRLTVIDAHGKIWLFAIAEENWRAPGGERVAALGPLQSHPGKPYKAHYVEAVFPPGMKTGVHFHHGTEASFVVSGTECVETPNGKIVNRAGEGAVVPEHTPMMLTNPGPETRRAVALIVHDTDHNWSTLTRDWTPKGLCND
jgi:quercetin dioxygenase-like cupin family protein